MPYVALSGQMHDWWPGVCIVCTDGCGEHDWASTCLYAYRTNKMPQKGRPKSEKADLVDELARLGGDDLRYWGEDGTQKVDDKSAAYKAYSGVSVAVLRSRVAEFPPGYDDSEEDESASEAESSDDDESFHSGDDEPTVEQTPAPESRPWFGGIFSTAKQPPALVATKSRLDEGDMDDPDDIQAALQASEAVSDAINDAALDTSNVEELDVVEAAIDSVLEQSAREENPAKQAALIATASSELDNLHQGHLPDFASDKERSEAERQRLDALQTKLEQQGWNRVPVTDSQLTPSRPIAEQSRVEREQSETRIQQRLQFDQPHVSTVGAQHAAATVSTGGTAPPPSPGIEAVVEEAVDAAVEAENRRRDKNMQPSRVGSLVTGPPPQMSTAKAVTKLTQNLEDAPLVAQLVERGLLKTADVLNRDYVQAMESRLRQQAATKAAEGRDVRYTSARAGTAPRSQTTSPVLLDRAHALACLLACSVPRCEFTSQLCTANETYY